MSKQTLKPQHRRAIWIAHKRCCFYCQTAVSWDNLRIDHVIPEYLDNRPLEKLKILCELGLPRDWSLTENHNLVPSCDPCNSRKRASILPSNQLMLLLTKVAEKVSDVVRLRETYESEARADIIRVQLEVALASGLLSEVDVQRALARAAAGDDLVQLTSSLEFLEGVTLDRLRPSAVEELLDLPVRVGTELPEGLLLIRENGERFVKTSREYRDAKAHGFYSSTTFAMKMEAFFETVLGVLTALSACRPSERSFVRNPRVSLCDIDLLPINLLPQFGPETDEYIAALAAYATIGEVVGAGKAYIMRVSSYTVSIEFEGFEVYLREMLRADLDGDGFEDLLISRYLYATGGSMGFGLEPIALARRSPDAPFLATEIIPSPATS